MTLETFSFFLGNFASENRERYRFKPEATIEEYARRIYTMLETMNNILDYHKLEAYNQNKENGVIKGLIHFGNCSI